VLAPSGFLFGLVWEPMLSYLPDGAELARLAEAKWRKCMGIEPTDRMISIRSDSFEDYGLHQQYKHFLLAVSYRKLI
jgi:hypothetical protein